LRDAPTGLTFKICTLCHTMCVFCIYLRTNRLLRLTASTDWFL